MNIRSIFGIDGFELIVHAAVTGILIAWVYEVNRSQDAFIFASIVAIGSLVALSIRRRFGLRRSSAGGLTTGEMAAERLAELELRMAELEAGQARVAELEERLDFAERLLAQPPADQRVLAPGEPR